MGNQIAGSAKEIKKELITDDVLFFGHIDPPAENKKFTKHDVYVMVSGQNFRMKGMFEWEDKDGHHSGLYERFISILDFKKSRKATATLARMGRRDGKDIIAPLLKFTKDSAVFMVGNGATAEKVSISLWEFTIFNAIDENNEDDLQMAHLWEMNKLSSGISKEVWDANKKLAGYDPETDNHWDGDAETHEKELKMTDEEAEEYVESLEMANV